MAFGDPGQQDARSSLAVEQLESAAKSAGCRLLVLPEGVARVRRLARDVPFRVDPAVPIVFGAQRGSGPIYQSAVGFDGRWQYVDKTRLVIFGEFVPGRDFLPFLSAFHLASGDISAGTGGTKAMTIGGLPVGPIICFEALFPDIAWKQSLNGAHMLAVISIDDWFMGSSAPDELRAGTVWRAVETGLPVVRAATLGWSLAADGHGNILVEAPMGATEAPRVQLPVPDHPLVGYWLPVFPALSLLTLLALPWLRRRESTLR
jgi:apolipoprotein N-acyltransferase